MQGVSVISTKAMTGRAKMRAALTWSIVTLAALALTPPIGAANRKGARPAPRAAGSRASQQRMAPAPTLMPTPIPPQLTPGPESAEFTLPEPGELPPAEGPMRALSDPPAGDEEAGRGWPATDSPANGNPAADNSANDADESFSKRVWKDEESVETDFSGNVETEAAPGGEPAEIPGNGPEAAPLRGSTRPSNGGELTPELAVLREKVRKALAIYEQRRLNTRDHCPWEVMHAFVAFNVRTQLRRDGPDGPLVNAIGWILWGGRCQNQQILTLRGGRPYGEEGPGVQGHPGQLLAILAQSRVNADTPMRIDGREFALRDLIEEEKLGCKAQTELTFKLIALSHYLPSDAVWKSRDGETWSIPRLIREEIRQPIRGAACGGTHRLFGISMAYKNRLKRGEPLDGEYLRAKKYIADYHRYTRTLQNPDGSFSTEWFNRRGNRADLDRKIQTTGHILEWLVASLDDAQLRDPHLIKSVDFLAQTLLEDPDKSWAIGPLGHALHALVMYDERVFKPAGSPPAVALRNRSSRHPLPIVGRPVLAGPSPISQESADTLDPSSTKGAKPATAPAAGEEEARLPRDSALGPSTELMPLEASSNETEADSAAPELVSPRPDEKVDATTADQADESPETAGPIFLPR